MFLFKKILFNIGCWLINTELMAYSTITHAWTRLIEHVFFFVRHSTTFLYLGTLDSTSALFGSILNNKVTKKKKHKKCEKHITRKTAKTTPNIFSKRTKTRRQNITLLEFKGEQTCIGQLKFFTTPHMFPNDHEITVSIDIGLTNKF